MAEAGGYDSIRMKRERKREREECCCSTVVVVVVAVSSPIEMENVREREKVNGMSSTQIGQ